MKELKILRFLLYGACVLLAPYTMAQQQSWFCFYPYDFASCNVAGDSIVYCFSAQHENAVVVGQMTNNESLYLTDSLVIPSSVTYNGEVFPVVGCGDWAFYESPLHVTSITLPETYQGCDTAIMNKFVGGADKLFRGTFAGSRFERIHVNESNPFYSDIDGVLYTKDFSQIVAYPSEKKDTSYSIKQIGSFAFLQASSLREIVLKDSIQYIGALTIPGSVNKIVLGNRINAVNEYFWDYKETFELNLSIYAVKPPQLEKFNNTLTTIRLYGAEKIHLYVPRQSLTLYQQAKGWQDCATILPIEPPIVTGVDTASVSWVQNFSATGYVWTLYLDEAKTQRFMSLTFDANGHLTHIDLNSGHMPERMPALYNEDGEEEKRFAEYYSFTITGLQANTQYYYTRQSLSGTEVIDEEVGSFSTLDNGEEGLGDVQRDKEQCAKTFRDGHILIQRADKTYTLQGQEVK